MTDLDGDWACRAGGSAASDLGTPHAPDRGSLDERTAETQPMIMAYCEACGRVIGYKRSLG